MVGVFTVIDMHHFEHRKVYISLSLHRLCIILLIVACLNSGSYAENQFIIEPDDKGGSASQPLPSQIVRTQTLNIHYKITDVAPENLARVELWYARGYDGLWQLYDYDEDRVSPIRFVAPEEGIFRFFVVAIDRWGKKSLPFVPSDNPLRTTTLPIVIPGQQVVFIDYTPPQLYLYSPRGETAQYYDHQITIRWAGFDSHLDTHCVQLFFQSAECENWTLISPPLPAIGEFNWNLPDRLAGPIAIKAMITDQAGNWKCVQSDPININGKLNTQNAQKPRESSLTQLAVATNKVIVAPSPLPPASDNETIDKNNKALDAFRWGNIYSQRMDWRQAANSYQEAIDYCPELIEARVNLSNTLYRLGHFEEAQQNFELCLKQQPQRLTALFGLAQTCTALKQFEKAQQTLQKLTQLDPQDWQAWLILGDICKTLGQDTAAKEAWNLALEGNLPSITQMAKERLNCQP